MFVSPTCCFLHASTLRLQGKGKGIISVRILGFRARGLDFTLVVIAAGVTGYGKTDANIGRPGGM